MFNVYPTWNLFIVETNREFQLTKTEIYFDIFKTASLFSQNRVGFDCKWVYKKGFSIGCHAGLFLHNSRVDATTFQHPRVDAKPGCSYSILEWTP